jgi:hypothetical protein
MVLMEPVNGCCEKLAVANPWYSGECQECRVFSRASSISTVGRWSCPVALFYPQDAQAFKPRTGSSESYAIVHLCFSEYKLWLLPSPSSTALVLLAMDPSSEYAKARTKMAMNKRMRSKHLI